MNANTESRLSYLVDLKAKLLAMEPRERASKLNELDPKTRADVESALDSNRIGPFERIKLLGEGGEGEVWLARDITSVLGRYVAVKVLNRRYKTDFEEILREAKRWAEVP